jgi:CSLREA domain-containing protein
MGTLLMVARLATLFGGVALFSVTSSVLPRPMTHAMLPENTVLRTTTAVAYTVTSTADAVDAAPGDGVCATVDGVCTVRAALQESNATPGAATITVPEGTDVLRRDGANEDAAASGDLDITDEVTIVGADAQTTILDGGARDRVLDIRGASTVVQLRNLTVQHGRTAGDNGAGIRTEGALTLEHVQLKQNVAASPGISGGGIMNVQGTLTISATSILSNQAGAGGGIWSNGRVTMIASTVAANQSSFDGGGIVSRSTGMMALQNVTISGNRAGNRGGGVYNR